MFKTNHIYLGLFAILFLSIFLGCTKNRSNDAGNKQTQVDSVTSKMDFDSVITNFIKPIPVDSLRKLIEADTGLKEMKPIMDSLLNELEKDSN